MSNDPHGDWAGPRGHRWRQHLVAMEATLVPIDEQILAALSIDAGTRMIADVGCGGGATTRYLFEHSAPGTTVHGVDICAPLIESARAHPANPALGIEFHIADVGKDSPSTSYDRLCGRFSVMFFDDPSAAFSNLRSWLAPGGRFVFAVWGPQQANPWFAHTHAAVAQLVHVLPTPENAPGTLRYADPTALLDTLKRAGFADLRIRTWRGSLALGGGLDAQQAAVFALATSTSGAPIVDTPDLFAQATGFLARELAAYEHGGVVMTPACVHLVSGRRPHEDVD